MSNQSANLTLLCRQALYEWDLHGPTLFAPSIRNAASVATSTQGARPPKYTCLLILTDGAIGDMDVSGTMR